MESCMNCIHREACKDWLKAICDQLSFKIFLLEDMSNPCSHYDNRYTKDDTTPSLLDDIDTIVANNVVEQHYHGNHFVPTSVNIGIVGDLKKLREKYGE